MNNHTVHPHPTQRDITVHMNAMMLIHISNSNGSYTIIFHIIQTVTLTLQLACINISFSMHISSHSIQANSHGQFRSNKQIRIVFNSPKPVRGLSKDGPPSSSISSTSWNRNPWPFLASQHPKPFSWLFRQRVSKPKKTHSSRSLSKLLVSGLYL